MAAKNSSRLKQWPFSPINKAHAIVEVVFFVQFVPDFSETAIRKLVGVEHDLKDELPKSSQIHKIETALKLGPEGPQGQFQEKLTGMELQSIKRDGSLDWMLRISENTISVHCLDYSTWEKVWQQARKYLYRAFKRVEGTSSFIAAIGLKYIDRFLYEGNEDEYNASGLFDPETDLIFRRAFSSTPLWHCHSG